ncbi:unnamed protein product [Diamesa serratosioi]
MSEDISWRSPSFRQSVVNKINEAIQISGVHSNINGVDMEIRVFSKAKNKDEYLSFVARLIIHVREMITKKHQINHNLTMDNNDSEILAPRIREYVSTCCICFENLVNTVLIPCGHLTLCFNCASERNGGFELKSCPICRTKVQKVIKTYRT